jgi:hypothetical protein
MTLTYRSKERNSRKLSVPCLKVRQWLPSVCGISSLSGNSALRSRPCSQLPDAKPVAARRSRSPLRPDHPARSPESAPTMLVFRRQAAARMDRRSERLKQSRVNEVAHVEFFWGSVLGESARPAPRAGGPTDETLGVKERPHLVGSVEPTRRQIRVHSSDAIIFTAARRTRATTSPRNARPSGLFEAGHLNLEWAKITVAQ